MHRLTRLTLSLSRLRTRAFTTTPHSLGPRPLPPRPVIHDAEITESFLKGTGPGGQKINKTSSAVQLKHLPTGLVIKCQETRSRSQNRKIARRILAERIEVLELGDESRVRKREKVEAGKKASKGKKSRRKYRALAEAKAGEHGEVEGREAGGEDEEGEDDDDDDDDDGEELEGEKAKGAVEDSARDSKMLPKSSNAARSPVHGYAVPHRTDLIEHTSRDLAYPKPQQRAPRQPT